MSEGLESTPVLLHAHANPVTALPAGRPHLHRSPGVASTARRNGPTGMTDRADALSWSGDAQTVRLSDGRALGFASYGDPDAPHTVVYFHGSGGSRLEHPTDPSTLSTLGVRLVATDRPGHGLSSPQRDRRLEGWASDVAQLADHLGAESFFVMGWSAGGPHALACARYLPARVSAGAVVSGLAPFDRPRPYEGMPLGVRVLNMVGRSSPTSVRVVRGLMHRMVTGEPDVVAKRLSSSLPPPDRRLVQSPEVRAMLLASVREGYRQGGLGPAEDDIVINSPWGFRLEDVRPRIDLWHGDLDQNVPIGQGSYQHEKLPHGSLTVVPGQAHLMVVEHWRPILKRLVGHVSSP